MIRYRLAVLGIAILVWITGCFEPNDQQVWRDRLRLPTYMPDYLRLTGVSEKSLAEESGMSPGAKWDWEGVHHGPVPPGTVDSIKSPGVIMVQFGAEFDLDMGGERVTVEVDGVTGWFTRLDAKDFYPPDDSPSLSIRNSWPQEAREQSGYNIVLGERRTPAFEVPCPKMMPGGEVECLPPEWNDSLLWGEAIALQWNRDGTHHLLIAQDIEPMNESELFKMANSMAPSDSLTPSS